MAAVSVKRAARSVTAQTPRNAANPATRGSFNRRTIAPVKRVAPFQTGARSNPGSCIMR